jgi:ribonuclease HI
LTTKALAAIFTLRFSIEVGLDRVCLEGDAKNVVDALNSIDANWSKISHIVEDAKILLQKFTSWEVTFVNCEANFGAHNLAKLAAQMGMKR